MLPGRLAWPRRGARRLAQVSLFGLTLTRRLVEKSGLTGFDWVRLGATGCDGLGLAVHREVGGAADRRARRNDIFFYLCLTVFYCV